MDTPNSYDWEKLRDEFELDRNYAHFALFLIAPHPARVRRAIDLHRKGLDSNPALYTQVNLYQNPDHAFNIRVHQSAAFFFGTDPNLIALTQSATEGLGIIYSGLDLKPGEEVLTTTHDHYSTAEALRFSTRKTGATLKQIALYDHPREADADQICQRIIESISHATRVIALTWVHSGTGVKIPIAAISKALSEVNQVRRTEEKILLCVDGVHATGIENFKMEELGCDFFFTSCHKWLFGPRGTGLIWGSQEGWARVTPVIPTYDMIAFSSWLEGKTPEDGRPETQARFCTPGGYQAFEHRWALPEAFHFQSEIGKQRITDRIHALNHYCKREMARIPGLTLYTPLSQELSSGMVCFDLSRRDPKEVVNLLLQKRMIASTTPYVNAHARLAMGILNSYEEVDAVLDVLKDIAAHRL